MDFYKWDRNYFSKMMFVEDYNSIRTIMILNIPMREFFYQVIKLKRKTSMIKMQNAKTDFEKILIEGCVKEDEVVFNRGIILDEKKIDELLIYCKVNDFEPFRDKSMPMEDMGYTGYRDGVDLYFVGLTDSHIPMFECSMPYCHEEKYMWPVERLYKFLVDTYLGGEKYGEYRAAMKNTKYNSRGRATVSKEDEWIKEKEWDALYKDMVKE